MNKKMMIEKLIMYVLNLILKIYNSSFNPSKNNIGFKQLIKIL